jgi:hypothetical protein
MHNQGTPQLTAPEKSCLRGMDRFEFKLGKKSVGKAKFRIKETTNQKNSKGDSVYQS